jgi:hypothetical protein
MGLRKRKPARVDQPVEPVTEEEIQDRWNRFARGER